MVGPADFSANDRFALDGQRLVCIGGDYGALGSAYDTEQAAFATITLMSVGGSNAAFFWFKVITKEGMTHEYGLDWNSKVLNDAGDAVVAWRLSRSVDPFGNYIVYGYEEGANSMLGSVRYTGNVNTGLQPYNRIDLTYVDGRADVLTRFGSGTTAQQSRLLTQVTVEAEGQLVRRYDLSYAWRDGRATYLNEINMADADGNVSYNPTQFAYGDVPEVKLTESPTGISPPNEYELFTGDFDGNGRSDMVIAEIIQDPVTGLRYHDKYKVYLNGSTIAQFVHDPPGTTIIEYNRAVSYTYTTPAILALFGKFAFVLDGALRASTTFFYGVPVMGSNEPQRGLSLSDVDGDGRDDIVIANLEFNEAQIVSAPPSEEWWGGDVNGVVGAWRFDGLTVLYSTSALGLASFTAPQTYTPPVDARFMKQPARFMRSGDFDGDGRLDMLFIFNITTYGTLATAWLFTNGAWVSINLGSYSSMLSSLDELLVGDCDADGQAELMLFRDLGSGVREYRAIGILASGSMVIRRADNAFNWQYEAGVFDLRPGDFNGDGITDYLARKADGNDMDNEDDWYIVTGTLPESQLGSDFVSGRFYFSADYDENDQVMIGDFDGNGTSDIAHYHNNEGWRLVVHSAYGHTGVAPLFHASEPLLLNSAYDRLAMGDLNGDGRMDLVGGSNFSTAMSVFMMNAGAHERRLAFISDGFGKLSRYTYFNLGMGFLTNQPQFSYPLNEIAGNLTLVRYLSVDNGAGTSTSTYSYTTGQYHRGGRGFLGFKNVQVLNEVQGKYTASLREVSAPYYVPVVKSEIFGQVPGGLLSTTEYSYMQEAIGDPSLKRFLIKLMSSSSTNSLSGATSSTTNAYDA